MLIVKIILCILLIWIFLECFVRTLAEKGVQTDFYGSVSRTEVRDLQKKFGVKIVQGNGWFHLGWVADPENERYLIQKQISEKTWKTCAEARFGSWLAEDEVGLFRVMAISKADGSERIIEEVSLDQAKNPPIDPGLAIPIISGEWQYLFRPEKAGSYLNDHCLFQDAHGNWRIMGISSHSRGDYKKEKRFAIGVGTNFPPKEAFVEDSPTIEGDHLAWAPYVIHDGERYHLFWSPHKLYHATSEDGIHWGDETVVMEKPFHKFFRDGMIFKVAPGQWLMFATGRGKWFSRIDIYQSFDLLHWQYIRPALTGWWGSERNFVTGSMESPFLIQRNGRFYLSITYNNETFFLGAVLLQFQVYLNRKAYNNTLIFHSTSPYDFGRYRGKDASQGPVARLDCHAPVYINNDGAWYVTTCGWPFAATLTKGEAAFARLNWKKTNGELNDVNKR
jgi:beta-fructofuranosidase